MKKHIITIMLLLAQMSLAAQENTTTVTGQVTDAATGAPLAGVIVSAATDNKHTAITDEQGNYKLTIPAYATSVQMKVEGYGLMQVTARDGKADARMFSDMYKRTYRTGLTSTLSSEAIDFSNTAEMSVDPLLTRQLGADMRQVSHGGVQGLGTLSFVNGINSLNADAQPLVVLDGVIMDMQRDRQMLHDGFYNNILANLNVNDIENVEVLKNGTALYGAKGANGVVLINTKRNKSMATKIDLTMNGRFERIARLPKMMGAEDYRLYASELLSGYINPTSMGSMMFLVSDPNYFYYKTYHNQTDWTDEVYRNAFSQNYGINVQGGDDAASYNLSVGYGMGNSTLKGNDFTRFNMRLNTDINVVNNFSVRFDASYSDVDRALYDDGAPAEVLSGVVTSPGFLGLAKAPFLSPWAYDKQGNLSHYLSEADDYLEGMFQGRGRLANPSSILEYGEGKNRNTFGNRLIMFSITPKYVFNKHLSLEEHFTLTLVNTNEIYYLPLQGVPNFYVDGLDEATTLENYSISQAARQTGIQSDTRLNWNLTKGANAFRIKGGLRFLSNSYKQTWQKGYNSGNDKTPNQSASLRFKQTGGADDRSRELVWYALGDYTFADRYCLSAGISAQSSSRFGDDADGLRLGGVTWGLFPSLGAAWVVSNENWFPRTNGINYLRLNAGYDVTGNDDIDYTASRSYFVSHKMLGETVGFKTIGNIGNTKLRWETTRRLSFGLEGNFFANRLNLRFNAYKSWTSGLLALRQLAWTSGMDQNWTCDGKLENAGFDIAATLKLMAKKNFDWEAGFSAGHYKNKVTALPDGNKSIETDIYGATVLTQVGQPVGVFYGYRTNGVYSKAADAAADGNYIVKDNGEKVYYQAGDMRFVNMDDSREINENDRTIIGDPNPSLYGNIFTTLRWKKFTLRMTMNYSIGGDIYNYQRSMLEGGSLFLNQTTAMNNRWTTEGQVTDIPRISYNDPMGNSRFSDRWIEDGSYLRMSDITLSYHLPIQSTYLQGITLYGSIGNLFTITPYLGSDPDCAMQGSVLTQGIDRGITGAGRTFSFGVNVNL